MYVAGAKVVSLEPNTIGDIFDNILTVGELTGADEKAKNVVEGLKNRLDAYVKRRRMLDRVRGFLCWNGSNRLSRPVTGCPSRSKRPAGSRCLARRVNVRHDNL